VTAGELGQTKDTGKIHFDDGRPIFFEYSVAGERRIVAGIVNQNIEPPEVRDRFVDSVRGLARSLKSPISARAFRPVW